MKNDEAKDLSFGDLDGVAGGVVKIDPNGSIETEDKYLIMDDKSGEVLAKTGGYRRAESCRAAGPVSGIAVSRERRTALGEGMRRSCRNPFLSYSLGLCA